MTEEEKKISLRWGVLEGKERAEAAGANHFFIVGYSPATADSPAILCTYCELNSLAEEERKDYCTAIGNALEANGIIQEMNKIRKKEEGAAN